MPLTRNLYDLDEVESALLVSLMPSSNFKESAFSSKPDCAQSAFWSWELEVSQESERAHQILNRAWLYWGGGINPFCLRADQTIQQKHALVAGAIAITTKERTAHHLLKFTASLPHRPTRTPPPASKEIADRRSTLSSAHPSHMQDWIISLDAAIRQHHPVDAVWLLQAAWHRPDFTMDAIWTALKAMVQCPKRQEVMEALMESRDEDERLYQTALVLHFCYRNEERLAPPPCVTEDVWPSFLPGSRGSRLFAVPPEALTAATLRGSVGRKYTTIDDLRRLDFSTASAFWQLAVAEVGGITDEEALNGVVFPSEDVKEAWFERHFPDDIPDEWSAEEQAKSHGRCCGEKALAPFVVEFRREPVSAKAWEWATLCAPIHSSLRASGGTLCVPIHSSLRASIHSSPLKELTQMTQNLRL
jgi:hypothetical protein